MRPRVLFLCTGNACRSQMAEGWLRHLADARFSSLSAGTQPAGLNARAVTVMAALGIDISDHQSKGVESFLSDPPDLVITVCDHAAESCPTFPRAMHLQHWRCNDPAGAVGGEEEVLAQFRSVRDAIGRRISSWLDAGAPLEDEPSP